MDSAVSFLQAMLIVRFTHITLHSGHHFMDNFRCIKSGNSKTRWLFARVHGQSQYYEIFVQGTSSSV